MTQKLIGELVRRYVDELLYKDTKIYKEDGPVSNPDMYVGVELEIENWRGGGNYPGLSAHADNSLRNNGIEWITYPTKLRYLENLLTGFFRKNNVKQDVNYSERTSTHVHVNVQDHTPSQLTTVVLLYQLFERLLFNFVGNDRKSNIFCVPWYQAGVTYELVERIEKWDYMHLHAWQKYTALNLLTIEQKGTVEYRHLEGTCDVARIMTWCNMLGSMHAYAKANDLEEVKRTIKSMNTSSAYDVFLQSVFGQYTPHLQTEGHIIAMEEGVLDCKYMLSQPIKKEVKQTPVDARIDQITREMRAARQEAVQARPAAPRNQFVPVGSTTIRNSAVWRDDSVPPAPAVVPGQGAAFTFADAVNVVQARRNRNNPQF